MHGAGHGFPDFVGQRIDGHAGNRVLAGRIDVGENDFIGERQRRAEVAQQMRGARVAMRLEHAQDPAGAGRSRSAQHRGDFGRMMAVVVHDHSTVRLALALETALGAAELGQRRRDDREGDAEMRWPPPTTASALSTLCRPGTWSVSVPSTLSRPSALRRTMVACDP